MPTPVSLFLLLILAHLVLQYVRLRLPLVVSRPVVRLVPQRTGDAAADAASLARLRSLRRMAEDVLSRLDDRATAARGRRRLRSFVERAPPDAPHVASTVDKGRIVELCLRDAHTGRLHDELATRVVFLHELAHVLCVSHGHTPEFYAHERALLRAAREGGWLPREGGREERREMRAFCGTEVVVG